MSSDGVHESFVSDYVLPRRFDYLPKFLGVISGVTPKLPKNTRSQSTTNSETLRDTLVHTEDKTLEMQSMTSNAGKMLHKPKPINKKPPKSGHPLIGHKSHRGRKESLFSLGICHIIQNGPAEFASPHDWGNRVDIYQTKMVQQNGTLTPTMCNAHCILICTNQTKHLWCENTHIHRSNLVKHRGSIRKRASISLSGVKGPHEVKLPCFHCGWKQDGNKWN